MVAVSWALLRWQWKLALAALSLALAFAAGWVAHRPPPAPAVALKTEDTAQKADDKKTDQHKAEGPVQIVTQTVTKYRDVPVPATCTATVLPGVAHGQVFEPELAEVDTTTTETRGPVVTDTHELEHATETDTSKLDLTVTPPPAGPRYSVALGLDDPLGAQSPHVEVGFRLLTIPIVGLPLWLRVGSTPARGLVHGTTVMGEVQF